MHGFFFLRDKAFAGCRNTAHKVQNVRSFAGDVTNPLFRFIVETSMKNKKRFSKGKTVFTGILCICLLFVCSCNGAGETITIGSGNPEGTYFEYAENFAKLSEDDIPMELKSTAGTVASIRLLNKGFIDGAIIQNDLLYSAVNGTDSFESAKTKNNLRFSAVAGLYTEAFQLVTTASSGIESVGDLAGKRVSVGENESGVLQNVIEILPIYGMSLESFECSYLSFSDSSDALREGEIDAFFCMAGAPTSAVTHACEEGDIRIISLSDEDIEKIRNLHPYFEKCIIPAGTYADVSEDIQTVGVRAVFVVSNSTSSDTVKKLTENLLLYSEELNKNIATDGALTPDNAACDISIPFHPGAAEYYRENGIEVTESTGKITGLAYASQNK